MDVAANGTVMVGLDGEDWFGPGRPSLPPRVGEPATAVDQLCEVASEAAVDALRRLKARFASEPYIQFASDLALKRICEV